jgi:diguanylate cyclase (GGDEF)-like protein
MVPAAVEISILLVFCAVLYHFRHSLTPRSLLLWLFLWSLRGAASFTGAWLLPPDFVLLFYLPVQAVFGLALALIVYRMEDQKKQLRRLNDELERLRKETAAYLEVDPLTGVLSRSALTRWVDEEHNFEGIVVVCDLDDFKPLNDVYGHLVGDEVLHGVGKLLTGSIREEDRAFRWGGDEFVIFFRGVDADLVTNRMRGLEERLRKFQIRNHGPIVVRFSWGMAATGAQALRETLAAADRQMYECKRARQKKPV